MRSYLMWALFISIVLHLIFGPFVGRYKPYASATPEIQRISLRNEPRTATPKPTPPPRPLEPARLVKPANVAQVPKPRLRVVHATSKSSGSPGEQRYVEAKPGAEGIRAGPAQAGSPGPQITAAAALAPSPTPKPACAQPHVDAAVKSAVAPDYPAIVQQQGVSGVTQVKVTLTETGVVSDASVYQSSGNALLDRSAMTAARQSTYAPEVENCVKVSGSYVFRAEFSAQ
ncbi:MAG TPA: TonB family protein [Candidatus Baltobacteraceae bacterium]|nr:TonB family protein [Candidatus Baltobacteraceae bacterium]